MTVIGITLAVVLGIAGIGFQNWAARSGYNYTVMMLVGVLGIVAIAFFIIVITVWHGCHGAYDLTANPFACTADAGRHR